MPKEVRKNNFVTIFLVLLVAGYFIQPIQSTLSDSRKISTQGTIVYGGGRLLLSVNFDSFKGGQVITGTSIPGLGVQNYLDLNGPTKVWIEDGSQSGIPMRRGAGTKVLGQEVLPSNTSSPRNEFDVYLQSVGISQKAFVSTWLYLPSNFKLTVPNINWNWFEIVNPMCANDPSTGYYPKVAEYIGQPDITKMQFQLTASVNYAPDTPNRVAMPPGIYNWAGFPRGQWFNLKWFVDRTTGTAEVWISLDGVHDTMFGYITGQNLMGNVNSWFTEVSKIYGSLNGLDYKIWSDGFEIWTDIP